MARSNTSSIALGSGKLYMVASADTFQSYDTVCTESNLLGYIKGGATLTYTEETYEEKDDLGVVSKVITTEEEAILKAGILTWNADTLAKLIDRCKVTEDSSKGTKTAKIGGAENSQGNKSYAICFHYHDEEGDIYVLIKGRNTAGVEITFAKDSGTVINPEFKALPHDDNGTLIEVIEKATTTSGATGM